jgi:tetratricopeptide (TPR) repeat protein
MKEFIVQLDVNASDAMDVDGAARRLLDKFVQGLERFSTIARSGNFGPMWVYVYDESDHPDLDDLVRRMINELPPLDEILKLDGVESAVVSIGVMSDQGATSTNLKPETIRLFSEKLKGVGMQFMFYPTDFSEDAEVVPMPDPFDEIYRLSRAGKYDAALAKLIDEDGAQLMSPYGEDLNHGWYVAGGLYYKKGNFEAAARAFDRSVADRPDDHEALMALANCYFEIKMPGLSEKYLRIALKYKESAGLLYNLGNALFDQEKYAQAIEFYQRVSEDSGEIFGLARKNIRKAKKLQASFGSDGDG